MSYNKKQCGIVTINLIVPIIGFICLIFFGTLLIISLCAKAGFGLYIVLGFFCLMSLFMILTLNQKIEYSPMGFTYRDMLRINHKYDYSQVKKIRYGKDVTIHIGYRIILIDSMADNGKKFARIAMQYSDNAKIITDSQSRLFNGNVKSPGEFVFIYVIIGLIPIAFSIFVLISSKEIEFDMLNVYSNTISDFSFDMVDDDSERIAIHFYDNENTFISWKIDKNSTEYNSFQNDIKEKKVFQVYYLNNDETSDGLIKIYQLSCNEKDYVSLESINKDNCETRFSLLIVSVIIEGVWLLYVIISSYVMCNADKYPRLIKNFVKSDYIVKK